VKACPPSPRREVVEVPVVVPAEAAVAVVEVPVEAVVVAAVVVAAVEDDREVRI
jgi:hypothetical protein